MTKNKFLIAFIFGIAIGWATHADAQESPIATPTPTPSVTPTPTPSATPPPVASSGDDKTTRALVPIELNPRKREPGTPIVQKAELGVAHASKEGNGITGALTIDYAPVEVRSKVMVGLEGAPVSSTVLPRLEIGGRYYFDPSIKGNKTLSPKNASLMFDPLEGLTDLKLGAYIGTGVERNMMMDREFGVKAEAGIKADATYTNFKVKIDAGLAAGMRDSKDSGVPYIEGRLSSEVEACLALDDAKRNKLCGDVMAAIALGLIQIEVNGGIGASYQHLISDRGEKLYIRAGTEAAANADFGGTHSFSQTGIAAGAAF